MTPGPVPTGAPEAALKFLENLRRFDLAMLLGVCEASLADARDSGIWIRGQSIKEVVIHAPPPVDEALRACLSGLNLRRLGSAWG